MKSMDDDIRRSPWHIAWGSVRNSMTTNSWDSVHYKNNEIFDINYRSFLVPIKQSLEETFKTSQWRFPS